MTCRSIIATLLRIAAALLLAAAPADHAAATDPAVYEPGVDPGVGFNLISWFNFGSSGASVWENAVESIADAGFDEVSISPVRFYTIGSGSIAASSSQGPELSHIAAGITRAKELGLRVTVNPFVEPVGFSTWRGFYNPDPGSSESNTFWGDYEDYIADVAAVAEANGADALTIGTELRGLTRNTGNNEQWASVIEAADARFSGSLGYAANWDNFDHPNVASTIWDHEAIDFLGIDSYFQNLLTRSQADNSGSLPNPDFVAQVEAAWNDRLDNDILPFAAARQSGAGLPVEFTEVGYLPYNRTTVTPQNSSGQLDPDEQTMAFEGLLRALDGRLASGEFLATHIWQWSVPGSNGSLWNFDPAGGDQPNNQQTAQWLSQFVSNPASPDPQPDFNGDGVVDAADYTLWRDTLGQTDTGLAADGNGDGVVDTADYDLWRSNFGLSTNPASEAAAAIVPEPAAAWLMLSVALSTLSPRGGCRSLRRRGRR